MFVCEQLTIPYGDKMMNQHQTITCHGREYPSIFAFAKEHGVNANKVIGR